MKVLKFGGTSVGTAASLRRVVEVVRQTAEAHRAVVVVSAASGVTDALVEMLEAMQRGAFSRLALVKTLWARHHVLAAGLLRATTLREYEAVLGEVLLEAVRRVERVDAPTPALGDDVLALGERLSAPLLALALHDAGLPAISQDAAALVRTDDTHGAALVDLPETFRRVRRWHAALPEATVPVVTGFIGATPAGQTTTLGRGGSDYSAALFAAALHALVLERWTDVDGLYTDDPRTHADAAPLARLRLGDAWAWNRAGRLGMHRQALDPLVEAEIPVHVRCIDAPEGPGTWILPAEYEAPAAAAS